MDPLVSMGTVDTSPFRLECSDMELGDSVVSKSFDCTLAENRTDSSSAFWEVLSESVEVLMSEGGTCRGLLENKGTFPADTPPEVEIPLVQEVLDDSSLPKDFASSRK